MKIAALGSMAVICLLSSPAARSDDDAIKKEEVPAKVREAFQRAYPFVKVTGYEKEDRQGTAYYEVECRVGKLRLEMVYTPEGELYEIEQLIGLKAVPRAVIKSVKKAHPKSRIRKAERLTRGGKTLYEIYLKKGKHKMELVLDPEGKLIESEGQEKDSPQDNHPGK